MRLEVIKKTSDFKKVAQRGKRISTKGMIVQAIDSNTDIMRVGFTASKIIGGAVKRNKVKRRLRAVARLVLPSIGKNNLDYVLVGKKAAIDREFVSLCKDFKYALHSLDAVKKNSK